MGHLLKKKLPLTGLSGLISLFLACTAVLPAYGENAYYAPSDRPGWWWKNEIKEEQKEPDEPNTPKEEKNTGKPKERRHLKISDYPPHELWNMYPDDFTALLDDFKKQAVQAPTEENVQGYLTMQDLARRKAYAYSNVTQVVLQKHPELSVERDYPVAGPGKEALRQMNEQDLSGRILAARTHYALIYFYKNGCPYCEAQEKILSYFVDSRKWTVKGVDISASPELAARFNIAITPSLLLIKQGNDGYLPLSSGVISLNELEERIYNGVRLLDGEITPEQFNMREFQRGGSFDTTAPLSH